jgi:hypothetical protein
VAGKQILLGDENLTYAEYFRLFFRADGRDIQVPVLDEDHPLLPSATLFPVEKRVVYEPAEGDIEILRRYTRHDVERAVQEIAAQYTNHSLSSSRNIPSVQWLVTWEKRCIKVELLRGNFMQHTDPAMSLQLFRRNQIAHYVQRSS